MLCVLLQLLVSWVQSGVIGDLKQCDVQVLVPSWAFNKNDIRFQFRLAGERRSPQMAAMTSVSIHRPCQALTNTDLCVVKTMLAASS